MQTWFLSLSVLMTVVVLSGCTTGPSPAEDSLFDEGFKGGTGTR